MKPTEMPAARLTAESIIRSFRLSKKKHLFVTGSKGSGKTTLLRSLAPLLCPESFPLPGIVTHAVPKERVLLQDPLTGQTAVIGIFGENSMVPVYDGFLKLGIKALSRAASSKCRWAYVDEIGYLESDCLPFQNALNSLLDTKSVLAALRSQDTSLLNTLKNRSDVFLIDLEHPTARIGCVIMASGLGRRFGKNKLMADFGGAPLIQRILDITEGNLFTRRMVVTRHETVVRLCTEENILSLMHDQPQRSDTVRLGLSALAPFALDGCLFCPADQPLVTRESIETLALSFSHQPDCIHRLGYGEIPGSPILFPSRFFPELCSLPEGKGGSWLAKKYPEQVRLVPARDAFELSDIDTAEDLQRLEGRCTNGKVFVKPRS